MAQQIKIDIIADVQQLQQGVDQANKQLGGLDASVKKVQGLTTAFIGVGVAAKGFSKVGGFIGNAIDAASAFNEVLNVNQLVFKEDAKAIEEWSKGAAKGFGQSQTQAIQAAAAFGGLLQNVGFTRQESISASKDLTVLASDLASAFDSTPADALNAIRSGLIGSSEPLRKYNVFISDAALKQEAMNMGLYSGKGALDQNTKAQATLSLVMKQTSVVQGDFANTADGLANSTRQLDAIQVDNAANIGKTFLPIMQQVNAIMIKVVNVFTSLPGPMQTVIVVTGLAIAILAPFFILISAIKTAMVALEIATYAKAAATKIATAAQWLFNAAMSANPIGLVILAIVAIIAIIVLLVKNWDTVTAVVGKVWDKIKNFAKDAWDAIKGFGSKVGGFVSDIVSKFNALPEAMFSVGRNIVTGIWDGIQGMASWLRNRIFDFFGNLVPSWAKKMLGINSPSKVFASFGQNIVAGLAQGINASENIAKSATLSLGNATVSGLSMPSLSSRSSSQAPIAITINAGLGTNGAALGREVSNAIKQYGKVSTQVRF
tara:strand:+ start:2399 stop:4033 length:1635 start_codon:yes stop_codon:yes gene_type:complete